MGRKVPVFGRLVLTRAHGLPFAIVLSEYRVLLSRPSGGGVVCLTMGLPLES